MNDNFTTRATRTSSRPVGDSAIPTITVGDVDEPVQQERITLSTLVPEHSTSNTETVNLRDILPETKKNDNKEDSPGVTIKESPQKEILKPGGIFDQYVQEKKREMIERMKEEDEKRAKEQEEKEVEDPTEEPDDEDKEEKEILSYSDYTPKVNNIVFKEVIENEEEIGEQSNDETVETNDDKDNHEKPFYQTIGYEDNYEYPEEYGDLPRDEDESPEIVEEEVKVENKVDENIIEFTTDDEYDEELERELGKDDPEKEEERRLEELKADITSKIKSKAKSLSLKGFTIAKKATVSNRILDIPTISAGKWPLMTTGVCIQVKEISGQQLEYMRENEGVTATAARNRLKIVYDHVVSPKPDTLEAWLKSIAFADYDHLFMPVYLAAFDQSNYMPQTCLAEKGKLAKDTGCGRMFLSDNIDIMDCVKFKDDECKKKFWDLYRSDRFNSDGLYVTEIIPISDSFAIAFRTPSIYHMLIESATYGREFMEKYNNVIQFMPYIDDIYWIDSVNKTLVKVDYKRYANNASKSAKSKVIRYSKIFDTFKVDEYANVQSIINSINSKEDGITYQVPEMTCPECGRVIPAEPISAYAMVFTRHRLGLLANSSIN